MAQMTHHPLNLPLDVATHPQQAAALMYNRTAGGSSTAAAAAAGGAVHPGLHCQPDSDAYDPLSAALPGVAFVNFRRRTVHAPGQLDYEQALPALAHDGSGALQFGACSLTPRAASASGTPYSQAAMKGSLAPQYTSAASLHWEAASYAGTMANSTMAHAPASIAATPTADRSPSSGPSSCSTPVSPKRHNSKPKWLRSVLRYATPKAKAWRSRQDGSMQGTEQEARCSAQLAQDMLGHQPMLTDEQAQAQLQLQMQLQLECAQQEELAFQQQYYEHGWDRLPEHIQQQLKEQFHAEFLLQLQAQDHLQQQLQQLQAAYPDMDPAILQEQLLQQVQQAAEQQMAQHEGQLEEQQGQQCEAVPDAAKGVYEQHMQYEALQQQLAGLQLPEHVQWMIQQHQQQQQQPGQDDSGAAQAPALQSQEFVYAAAAPAAVDADANGQAGSGPAPLVHVLDGPDGQVVRVTPDEFQDILTVMQALAGETPARHCWGLGQAGCAGLCEALLVAVAAAGPPGTLALGSNSHWLSQIPRTLYLHHYV